MNIHLRFLAEELRYGGKQSIMFVLCVVLSVATLTALNSFKRDIRQSLVSEARDFHGGDIIIRSSRPFSSSLVGVVDSLEINGQLRQLKTYEFYSVIRPDPGDNSLLVNIKAVDPGYPFYGSVQLESGKRLDQVLRPGSIVLSHEAMERLQARPGTNIRVGSYELEMVDVVTYESTRPVSFFSLGPRVFVSSGDLGLVELLSEGSRAKYSILLKITDHKNFTQIMKLLTDFSQKGQEQVVTAESAPSRVKRFFDNLLFFLLVTSLFTLLLSGIGMQGTLSSILRQKQQTIGVTRAVGATFRFLLTNYLIMVLILGLIGCSGGIVVAYIIKLFFPVLFSGLLPAEIVLSFSFLDFIEGLLLGLGCVCIFTFLPLYRLSHIKPAAIFRHEVLPPSDEMAAKLAMVCGSVFVCLLIIYQLEDVKNGIFFMLGLLSLIVLTSVAASGFMWLLKRIFFPWLPLRQAIKSLGRPGNATRSIMVTLGSAFAVLLTIFLLKLNLFATYVDSYPEDAPNLFCIDIQQKQVGEFMSMFDKTAKLFPVIRARLASINGNKVDREKEQQRKSDNLGREFNLTYRDYLLEDEILIEGSHLFGDTVLADNVVEVSILDTIAEIGKIGLMDSLVFNIQGVPITAQVTSIRSRTKSKLHPFFYFVFKEQDLEAAPKTFFTALHLPKEDIPQVITDLVTRMPNISTINVADMVIQFGRLFKRLSIVVTFFASFSVLAGVLIMISTMFATRPDRVREVAYFKVLGADISFIFKATVSENIILGLFSSMMAVGFAQGGSYFVCRYVFDIVYQPYWLEVFALALASVLLVSVVGLISTWGIARQRPAVFLRQQDGV